MKQATLTTIKPPRHCVPAWNSNAFSRAHSTVTRFAYLRRRAIHGSATALAILALAALPGCHSRSQPANSSFGKQDASVRQYLACVGLSASRAASLMDTASDVSRAHPEFGKPLIVLLGAAHVAVSGNLDTEVPLSEKENACLAQASLPETFSSGTAQPSESGIWTKSESTNPMDGQTTLMLMRSASAEPTAHLAIRFKGNALDVYLITQEVVSNSTAPVRIKFDDGAPVTQTWSGSTNYRGIFSPAPFDLAKRLVTSKTFYLEYTAFESSPKTLIFDVSALSVALPHSASELIDKHFAAIEKQVSDRKAADETLKALVLSNVHSCNDTSRMFPFPSSRWCWTDPNSPYYRVERSPFRTKEEAVESALAAARAGLIFQSNKP
jgi:hypothetical protein